VKADVDVVGLEAELGAYPAFHRAVDSALWPPTSAAKMAGA
jgi:hypothetical protein